MARKRILARQARDRHRPFDKVSTGSTQRLRTGGAGFLGSFVVEKLRERGAAEISVPRRNDYDLRDIVAIRQLLVDTAQPAVSGQRSAVSGRRSM